MKLDNPAYSVENSFFLLATYLEIAVVFHFLLAYPSFSNVQNLGSQMSLAYQLPSASSIL